MEHQQNAGSSRNDGGRYAAMMGYSPNQRFAGSAAPNQQMAAMHFQAFQNRMMPQQAYSNAAPFSAMPPNQAMAVYHQMNMRAAAVMPGPRPMPNTLQAMWQATAEPVLPRGSLLVAYEALKADEFTAVDAPASEAPPEGVAEQSLLTDGIITRWDRVCDVCNEVNLLRDISSLPHDQLFRLGRRARQTHQCVCCGVIVHRHCYGLTACVLKEPLYADGVARQKACLVPNVPSVQGIQERPVLPPNKTFYCRFLCDACSYMAALAKSRQPTGADFLGGLPLGGRCLLCANARGPRKLVTVQRAAESTLPERCFAHAFCLLTAAPDVVVIEDWKNFTNIIVKEETLMHRHRHIRSLVNADMLYCNICQESIPGIGLSLELCQHWSQPLDGESTRCTQVAHALCARQFVAEYENRNDMTYDLAFESSIAARPTPTATKPSDALAFGHIRCLNHAFCGDNKDAVSGRKCMICHSAAVEPVNGRQWTSCRICGSALHIRCCEKTESMREAMDFCHSCRVMGDALKALSQEWEQSSLSVRDDNGVNARSQLLELPALKPNLSVRQKIALARHRLAAERFNASLAQTAVLDPPNSGHKSGRTLLGDPLMLLLSTILFSQSASEDSWRRPLRVSFSAYLLLKSIAKKRQDEWLLATTPEALPGAAPSHQLLSRHEVTSTLYPLADWLPAPSIMATATVDGVKPAVEVKKRIVMKKRAVKPTLTPQLSLETGEELSATEGGSSVGTRASKADSPNDAKRSAVVRRSVAGGVRRKLAGQQVEADDGESGLRKKRRLGETKVGTQAAKASRGYATPRGLRPSFSIFGLLLLTHIIPLIPCGSSEEAQSFAELKNLTLKTTQALMDLMSEGQSGHSEGIRSLATVLAKFEVLRRGCISYHPSVFRDVESEETLIVRFSGAQWMRSLQTLAKSTELGLAELWKDPGVQTLAASASLHEPQVTLALSLSSEMECTRWLCGVFMLQNVVARRLGTGNGEATKVFSAKELKSILAMLAETTRDVVHSVAGCDAATVDEHLQRFSGLLQLVRQGLLCPLTMFDEVERAGTLPYPFFVSLAQYYTRTPGALDHPIPAALLPPSLLFHVRNDVSDETLLPAGPLGVVQRALQTLTGITKRATGILADRPINLDSARAVLSEAAGVDIPKDSDDTLRALENLRQTVATGEQLEELGQKMSTDIKTLKQFVKALVPGGGEEVAGGGDSAGSQHQTDMLSVAHRFTSAKLQALPQLVTQVDNWRRDFAKMRAMSSPQLDGVKKRSAKMKLTAGGAVKLSGETGHLLKTSAEDDKARLIFNSPVPLREAVALAEAGDRLGLEFAELSELRDWIRRCNSYQVNSQVLIAGLDSCMLWKIFAKGDKTEPPSSLQLLTGLVHLQPPCVYCTARIIVLPLGLNHDFCSLPFSVDSTQQHLISRMVESIGLFTSTWAAVISTCFPGVSFPPINLTEGGEAPELDTETANVKKGHFSLEEWAVGAYHVLQVLQPRESVFALEETDTDTRGSYDQSACVSCAASPEPEDSQTSKVARKLLALMPATQLIYRFVVQWHVPLHLIAAEVVDGIDADSRFSLQQSSLFHLLLSSETDESAFLCHPEVQGLEYSFTQVCARLSNLLVRLVDERKAVDQVESDLVSFVEGTTLARWALLCQHSIATENDPSRRWRLIALCVLLSAKLSIGSYAANTDGEIYSDETVSTWHETICNLLLKLATPDEEGPLGLSETLALALRAREPPVEFRLPVSRDLAQKLLVRSLSLISLFSRLIPHTRDDTALMSLAHTSLSVLSLSGQIERDIFVMLQYLTWSERARRELERAREQLTQGVVDMDQLNVVLEEFVAMSDVTQGDANRHVLFEEANQLMLQTSLKATLMEGVIEMLLNRQMALSQVPDRIRWVAEQRGLMKEPSQDQICQDFLAHLSPLLETWSDSAHECVRFPVQNSLLWRLCRGTCRLLLAPPTAPSFGTATEVLLHWVKGARIWSEKDGWALLKGTTIPGQVVAMQAMQNVTSAMSVRGLFSKYSALLREQLRNSVPPISVKDTIDAGNKLLSLCACVDDEGWQESRHITDFAPAVLDMFLEGRVDLTITDKKEAEVDLYDDWEQVQSEVDGFKSLCDMRLACLHQLRSATLPVETSVADVEETGPLRLEPGVRGSLQLAVYQTRWLLNCAACLHPGKETQRLMSEDSDSESEEEKEESRCSEGMLMAAREFLELKEAVIQNLKRLPLVEKLLFGKDIPLATIQKAPDTHFDLMLGGVLALELRRSLAWGRTQALNPNASLVECLYDHIVRKASLTPFCLPEDVHSWTLCAQLPRDGQVLPSVRDIVDAKVDKPTQAEVAHKIIIFPKGIRLNVKMPETGLAPLEHLVECLIKGIITHSPGTSSSIHDDCILRLKHLIIPSGDEQWEIAKVKLLISLLIHELLGVIVVLQRTGSSNEKPQVVVRLLHPLSLLSMAECAPLTCLSAEAQQRLREGEGNLPRTLITITKLLSLRLSVSSANLKSSAVVSFAEATDVFTRVDAVSARDFPSEFLDASRSAFNIQGSQNAELFAHLKQRMSEQQLSAFLARNSFVTTRPPRLLFFDLAAFQQRRQAFDPLIAHIHSLISGKNMSEGVFCTPESLQSAMAAAEELVEATRVCHPSFEQLAMYHEEVLAVTTKVSQLVSGHRERLVQLLARGRELHEPHWNARQKIIALQGDRRTLVPPMSSTELLFHLWDIETLSRQAVEVPSLTFESLKQLHLTYVHLIHWGRECNPQDLLGTTLGAMVEAMATVETHLSEAIRAFNVGAGTRILSVATSKSVTPLTLLPRLFFLPEIPKLLEYILPPSSPDFRQLLGFPYPFSIVDVAFFPSLEVARAISAWNVFAIYEGCHMLDCHETLFGGPGAPSSSPLAHRLRGVAAEGPGTPAWSSAAQNLLLSMLAFLPICSTPTLAGASPSQLWWRSLVSARLLRWARHVTLSQTRLDSSTDLPDVELGEIRWTLKIFQQYPMAMSAAHNLFHATEIPRQICRSLWELITNMLPCKGDPFNLRHYQHVVLNKETNALVFAPLSLTAHKLFGLGKAFVREYATREQNHTNEFADTHAALIINTVPPCLHPELQAFDSRNRLEGLRPDYIPFLVRAERLIEALRGALQIGKAILGEARTSIEAFSMRATLQGVAPCLGMLEDLSSSKLKVEQKFGVEINASPALAANAAESEAPPESPGLSAMLQFSSKSSLEVPEIHRVAWLASLAGPSLLLAQTTKRGSAHASTSASAMLVDWVERAHFPRTLERLRSVARQTPAMSDEAVDLYRLITRDLFVQSSDNVTIPSSPASAQKHLNTPISLSFLRAQFASPPPASDFHLLALLGLHCLVSPFPLTLLSHPRLKGPKGIYPSMLVYSDLLHFTTNQNDPAAAIDPMQMEEILTGPPEALSKLLSSRLSMHLKFRSFGAEKTQSSGLFDSSFAAGGQMEDKLKAAILPPSPPLKLLVPNAAEEYNPLQAGTYKKDNLENRLVSLGVLWWGPVKLLRSTLLNSSICHVLMRPTSRIESPVISTVMRCVKSWRRACHPREGVSLWEKKEDREEGESAETPAEDIFAANELRHAAGCVLATRDSDDICDACFDYCFGESDPQDNKTLLTANVPIQGCFTRCKENGSTQKLASVDKMLRSVTPLRVPFLLLTDNPEPFLAEVFPEECAVDCQQDGKCSLTKKKSRATKMVTEATRLVRFDAELLPTANRQTQDLRLRMLVSALPLEGDQAESGLDPLQPVHLCGWLLIYCTDQINAGSVSINDALQSTNTIRSENDYVRWKQCLHSDLQDIAGSLQNQTQLLETRVLSKAEPIVLPGLHDLRILDAQEQAPSRWLETTFACLRHPGASTHPVLQVHPNGCLKAVTRKYRKKMNKESPANSHAMPFLS